jgi:peptide/nickel transport system substrate-binding protein
VPRDSRAATLVLFTPYSSEADKYQMPSTRRYFTSLLASTAFLATAIGRAKATPKPGGELSVAFDGTTGASFSLDPHGQYGRFAPQARIMRSIYDSLVVLQPDQSVAPWLATSWQISPDRKQYTFQLRQGVVFHDGTKFDAAAVKANFDRIKSPANALLSLPQIGPYTGATVVSPYVVQVDFSEPFEPFLHNLSATGLAIVSPTAVATYGKALGQHPTGTGPFRFDSLTPGSEIRLLKNAGYQLAPANAAHSGPAYVDRLTFSNVPEQLTRVAALQSGQVQVADLIPSQNIAEFKADPDFVFLEKEMLDTNYALQLNGSKAPWDDTDIRKAVKLSLDIDLIVRVIYLGTIERAWSPLSHNLFGSAEQELTGSLQPDPAQAIAILNAKGWQPGPDGVRVKDGKRLTISLLDTQGNREQRLDVMQLVRHQLAASGIELTVDEQPMGNYLQKIENNDYDLIAGAQYTPDPDVLRYTFVPQFRSIIQGGTVNDPQLNQWLIAAAAEGDPVQRKQLYLQAQQRIIDQVYAIPIYILRYNLAVASAVQGVALDTHGFPNYHAASLGNA